MRFAEPTKEDIEKNDKWLSTLPDAVRDIAQRFEPWSLYRLKTTNHRVTIYSIDEGVNGEITVRVTVLGQFNFVTHERIVFGINPDDLEECDLPADDEPLGSLDMSIEELKKLMELPIEEAGKIIESRKQQFLQKQRDN